ncbi:MAG: 16S rRNA (cytosine(1402)-N(4))-methyltransferase RsmH [Sphingomonadales bacterium]|nr:16S rRNA (cytosine(1402)-N(4))-methyltransferase RsmH [Sphingomonadales bacterium]
MQPSYHIPVLLAEVIEGLSIKPEGVYVDCTFGGGGHARAILDKLGPKGRLVAFDQDSDARANLPADDRIVFVPENFRYLHRFLRLHGLLPVDGLLADLGVSSHQFDEASRGFSTRFDAPLDMRMDQRLTKTAFWVVDTYPLAKLHKIFEQYGEVTNAKTLAKTIVEVRATQSLRTIDGFKQAIRESVKGNPNKYFAQVFQALRMEVNDELDALKELLSQLPQVIKPGGRVAIISFHSLEDRMVKQFFKEGTLEQRQDHPFLSTPSSSPWKPLTKKPIVAGHEELKKNSRARSAKLRVALKTE